MIGLLSGVNGPQAIDEATARRVTSPLEPATPQAAPIDAVQAVEATGESDTADTRRAPQHDVSTDERLRQNEALQGAPVERHPDKTIQKMRQMRREAMASSEPGEQDTYTAAKASRVIRAAEAELAARRQEAVLEAARELAEVRDRAITVDEDLGRGPFAPVPAAQQVSEYQRQAVLSASTRLSSMPPPPAGFDSSV